MLANKITLLIATTLLPQLAFAFFCPANFNQINFGDTLDDVKKQCGKPDKEETKEAKKNVPQEWSYYVPQTVAIDTNKQAQGTLKTSLTFDKNGKVINLTVNGIGVGSSTICGAIIQLGDTQDKIKSACGEPSFVNKQQPADPANTPKEADKITELTYSTTPPVVLTFEAGVLTAKH